MSWKQYTTETVTDRQSFNGLFS